MGRGLHRPQGGAGPPQRAVLEQFGVIFCPSNVVKATANEESESSSLVKSQKNFSSNNNAARNNAGGLPRRREVTEEEAER